MTIVELSQKLSHLKTKLAYDQKIADLTLLEQSTQDPKIWQNPLQAQTQMRQLSTLKKTINQIKELEAQLASLQDFQTLLHNQPDLTLEQEITRSLIQLEAQLSQLELETYLSGKYDSLDAILAIHSGQGGTEAMDWASMLLRMYQRFIDQRNWQYHLLDMTPGEEAGIKSAYLKVVGTYAYGYLKAESGVHRLVRLSPYNADSLRQTSFAKVEVMPVFEANLDIVIKPEEIEFSAFRSGGHGGQNVNKVSSAVRLTHRPSGITVSCQSQRSQEQNRLLAMEMLQSKLWAIKEEQKSKEEHDVKGDNIIAGWGRQIRSYVLHPYKMVKDLRTLYETSDTTAVLDGHLDPFIEAELKR